MIILGIETSCDETGVSVLEGKDNSLQILSNVVASSMQLHSKTGGIIPEIAAREQIKYIIPVLEEALEKSKVPLRSEASKSQKSKIPTVDAIAVTVGPGLIGSLLVGVETARTLSYAWNKPLIPVNHLFGHIYANFIVETSNLKTQNSKISIEFPAIALIVSGGHTDLVYMENISSVAWIAGTRDDAAGEAYDKIGRLLGLPYPAGPSIEALAKKGKPNAYQFPRPLLHESTFDFSFSGLKTAVLREVQKTQIELSNSDGTQHVRESERQKNSNTLTNTDGSDWPTHRVLSEYHPKIFDLARATQDAIIEVLVKKTIRATLHHNAKSILLCGGVAANQTLRNEFIVHSSRLNVKFFAPPKNLCTDNGAMIAAAGFFSKERVAWKNITANPELYFD